eukprot:UN33140
MVNFLKGFDGFRNIPVEFTEATVHGGCLTICAIVTLITLFILEFGAFLTTTSTSTVLVDKNFDGTMRIYFNITVLDLPCKFTTVNLADEIGFRSVNETKNIVKRVMHYRGNELVYGDIHEDKLADLSKFEEKEFDRFAEVDSEGHHALAVHSEDEFNKDLQDHHLTFVNFYAPWCHWCRALKPHWEAAATKFDKLKFHHKSLKLKFVSVDCEEYQDICHQYKVRAFPALLLFKRKEPIHPFYEGERTEVKLIDFFKKAVKKYEHHMSNMFHLEACSVAGWVEVARVPGSFFIQGQAPPGHNLSPSMTNVSHIINHFQFGRKPPNFIKQMLPAEHIEVMHPLNGREFVVTEMHTAPHHYLKVVSTNFGDLERFWPYPFMN